MNQNGFQDKILDAAHRDDDTSLVEAVYDYFRTVQQKDYILYKHLKGLFIAARDQNSVNWKNLHKDEKTAVTNVLSWTGYSPNTIAVIIRTYERATDQLKLARRDGRVSRYFAETISQLYKGKLRDLQPRVIELALKYGLTREKLITLVEELQRTLDPSEQEDVIAKLTPSRPVPISKTQITDNTQQVELPMSNEKLVLASETSLDKIKKFSDNELWEVKLKLEQAIEENVLVKSLEQIKQVLRTRL